MENSVQVIIIDKSVPRLIGSIDVRGKVRPIDVRIAGTVDEKRVCAEFERMFNIPIQRVVKFEVNGAFGYTKGGSGEATSTLSGVMIAEILDENAKRLLDEKRYMCWIDAEMYKSLCARFHPTLAAFCDVWFAGTWSEGTTRDSSTGLSPLRLE